LGVRRPFAHIPLSWVRELYFSARSDSKFYAFLIKCARVVRWALLTAVGTLATLAESAYHRFRSGPARRSSSSGEPLWKSIRIDENELDGTFGDTRGGTKFLNRYSEADIRRAIGDGPLGAKLSEFGFPDWTVELDLSDPFNHYLYVRSPQYPDKRQYLIYIIVRTDQCIFKVASHSPQGLAFIRENCAVDSLDVLYIRWLSLQNPGKQFTADRPRLPGQQFPGSGLGRTFLLELRKWCLKVGRDGILNDPEHFHNAVLYKGFYFMDPYQQAQFNRMMHDLDDEIRKKSLATVSWAVGTGALRLSGTPFPWNMGEHVLPLSRKMISYFHSCQYTDTVSEVEMTLGTFTIDWAAVGRG
jgi:hypothetical protein